MHLTGNLLRTSDLTLTCLCRLGNWLETLDSPGLMSNELTWTWTSDLIQTCLKVRETLFDLYPFTRYLSPTCLKLFGTWLWLISNHLGLYCDSTADSDLSWLATQTRLQLLDNWLTLVSDDLRPDSDLSQMTWDLTWTCLEWLATSVGLVLDDLRIDSDLSQMAWHLTLGLLLQDLRLTWNQQMTWILDSIHTCLKLLGTCDWTEKFDKSLRRIVNCNFNELSRLCGIKHTCRAENWCLCCIYSRRELEVDSKVELGDDLKMQCMSFFIVKAEQATYFIWKWVWKT